jgi:hypothetical protein
MFKFSKTKIKAEANKLFVGIKNPNYLKNLLPKKNQKNFCINIKKISDKLSFLSSEEEMRKYFNIVDIDKNDSDFLFEKEIKEERAKFDENNNFFEEFDRKKLMDFLLKYKNELINTNKENKINLFEIQNEYSIEKEKVNK